MGERSHLAAKSKQTNAPCLCNNWDMALVFVLRPVTLLQAEKDPSLSWWPRYTGDSNASFRTAMSMKPPSSAGISTTWMIIKNIVHKNEVAPSFFTDVSCLLTWLIIKIINKKNDAIIIINMLMHCTHILLKFTEVHVFLIPLLSFASMKEDWSGVHKDLWTQSISLFGSKSWAPVTARWMELRCP